MKNYNEILEKCREDINSQNINSLEELELYRQEYLGVKGRLKQLWNLMKNLSSCEKIEASKSLKLLKDIIENKYYESKKILKG